MSADLLAKKANIAYQLSRVLYIGLLVVITLWTFIIDPPEIEYQTSVWLIRIVPLLLFITILFSRSPRSCAWLCFVVLFYFTAGVLNIFQSPDLAFGWLECIISSLLFCSAMMYVRWQYQLINRTSSQQQTL